MYTQYMLVYTFLLRRIGELRMETTDNIHVELEAPPNVSRPYMLEVVSILAPRVIHYVIHVAVVCYLQATIRGSSLGTWFSKFQPQRISFSNITIIFHWFFLPSCVPP